MALNTTGVQHFASCHLLLSESPAQVLMLPMIHLVQSLIIKMMEVVSAVLVKETTYVPGYTKSYIYTDRQLNG